MKKTSRLACTLSLGVFFVALAAMPVYVSAATELVWGASFPTSIAVGCSPFYAVGHNFQGYVYRAPYPSTSYEIWTDGPYSNGVLCSSAGAQAVFTTMATVGPTTAGNYWFRLVDTTDSSEYYARFYWDGAAATSTIPAGAIDWNALYFPVVYSTSSQAIAASSSLWESIDIASSTLQCTSGNLFSNALCSTGVFLFMPSTSVLDKYAELPSTISGKFPFSWVTGVADAFSGLSASSTSNMISPGFEFHNLGMGSTTAFGNFMPNVTVLSTSTIYTYISPTMWATLQALIAAGLWLGLAANIFFTVRDRMHTV